MFQCGTQFYVRDGVLVCNRVRAEDPSVSCVSLDGVSLFYRQTDHIWELGYSSGHGDFTRIADFETKAEARRALGRAQRKIKMYGFGRRLLATLLAVILCAVIYVLVSVAGVALTMPSMMPSSSSPSVPMGQPMSADQLLSAPN